MGGTENSLYSVGRSSPKKRNTKSLVNILFNTSKPIILAKYNFKDQKPSRMMK